jgi:uncharacterized protein (DUF1499 family)
MNRCRCPQRAVVASAAQHHCVGAGAGVDHVTAITPLNAVVTSFAIELEVAAQALDRVVATAPGEVVVKIDASEERHETKAWEGQ